MIGRAQIFREPYPAMPTEMGAEVEFVREDAGPRFVGGGGGASEILGEERSR